VCSKAWDEERGTFVAAYGSGELDASLLLLVSVGFLPPSDPRIVGTVEAVEQRLLVDGFVYRHDAARREDIAAREGAFLACSFWLVDARLMIGRRAEAVTLFKRLAAIANDVGLFAEEYDVARGCQLGNVPQAFSHVAFVNSWHNLEHRDKPADQRSDQPGSGNGDFTPSGR
jgi:GH15 family glucan-1,4-alpha-glucosidase